MDKRMKSIMDNIKKSKLTTESLFMFHCTMCGECCRNRDDIILNPKDLFNLATGLKMKHEDVVEEYCDRYLGHTSRMPIVRLKSTGFDRHCVFLENNGCKVHAFKPGVCAIFPLGRYCEYDKEGNPEGKEEISYMFTNPPCGDKREIHTVRSWLKSYGIPENDEFFLKWAKVLETLSISLAKIEKRLAPEKMEAMRTLVYFFLYLNYDTSKEFMPQFLQNADLTVKNIKNLEYKKDGEE